MTQATATLILKAGREKPLLQRHPWVFSGAIARISGSPAPGDVVDVADANGRFLARATFNPHSQIQARILTWEEISIDDAFWQQRLAQAIHNRTRLQLHPATTACRLVYAESDGLPGLIVDRYGDYLVMQCLTLGIERRKEQLARLLADLLQPVGIWERSDADVRQKEGLPRHNGLLWGTPPPEELIIQENGRLFGVSLVEGHKTGFYLDQRDNRALVCQPHFVAGKEILNVFAYTGSFSVYAAAHGAGPITNVDTSAAALTQAERNLALNGLAQREDTYLLGDAFQVLRHYRDNGRQFDLIILDPPKFAHSQRDVERAARGYKDLNWLALRLLRPGGLLATFSCSGLVSTDLFQKILFGAALDAQRPAQILYHLSQAPDHPILLTFPESAYLKGLVVLGGH